MGVTRRPAELFVGDPALPAPAVRTGRSDMPDPGEVPALRCHWVFLTDSPDGVDPWAFIPGCAAGCNNPGECDCDTLERRLLVQMLERRDLERALGERRRSLRAWGRAAAGAIAALTGREVSPYATAGELARAVRSAGRHEAA